MPKTSFTFEIPELTPSLNKLVKGRSNWRDYGRMKNDWFFRIKLATQNVDIPSAQSKEFRKVVIRSQRVSLLDRDNLCGGMKVLWDAMIAADIIYDDGPQFLDNTDIEQIPVKKRSLQKTVVMVVIDSERPPA